MSTLFGSQNPIDAAALQRRSFYRELNDLRGDIDAAFDDVEATAQFITGHDIYVDMYSISSTEDGSRSYPFRAIQTAIDYVDTIVPVPGLNDGIIIHIAPGSYDENLVIKTSAVMSFVSDGTVNNTRIRPTTGVPLTLTNATLASLATYRTTGVYSDLLAEATPEPGPTRVMFRNMSFVPLEANTSGVEALGVQGDSAPTTTSFLMVGRFENCLLQKTGTGKSIYARNALTVNVIDCDGVGLISLNNVGFVDCAKSNLHSFAFYFDAADPSGSPTWIGSREVKYTRFLSHVSVTGTDELSVDNSLVLGNLDVDDTASVVLRNTEIEGNVDLEAGAGLTAASSHVQGTLTAAAGAGVVEFHDSPIEGLITDAGSKIVHSRGNVRSGVITAVGAGDEVVAFTPDFPTTKYALSVVCEDTGAGIGTYFVKDGTYAVTGFTLTVSAAAKYHWKAELLG